MSKNPDGFFEVLENDRGSMRIKLIGLNARYTHSCLALFYIRNELEKCCINAEVEIYQFTINDSYYGLLQNITEGDPDYYFFSAAIWNSDLIVKLITDLRRCFPKSQCVVGGPQAEVVGILAGQSECTVVTGAIEQVDDRFYQDLGNRTLSNRYVCKKIKKGFSSPYRKVDFKKHLQNRHIYYETSRGCPFSCTYCLSSAEKGIFHKELDLVKDELSTFLSFNPKSLRFVDRTFNDTPQRALAIWQFLSSQDCDTVFHFEISPDRFTEEMFDLLARLPAGKFQFEIGIQSTNQETLKAVRRHVDTVVAHRIITRLRDIETIHLHVDLILGLPFETKTTFLQSFRDVFGMKPHYIQMGLLKILPDTPICHTAAEFGYCYSSVVPYSVFANSWMDHQTIQYLYWFSECVEKFINNRYFISLWEYFRKNSVDIVVFFQRLLQRCQNTAFFGRAATQELMCSLILECVEDWSDQLFILELLRYDWLRCGHRFLPRQLDVDRGESLRSNKKKVFQHLSSQGKGGSTKEDLAHCFKKGFFLRFSEEFVQYLGFVKGEGVHFLCFLPDRDTTLQCYNKVVYFSTSGKML